MGIHAASGQLVDAEAAAADEGELVVAGPPTFSPHPRRQAVPVVQRHIASQGAPREAQLYIQGMRQNGAQVERQKGGRKTATTQVLMVEGTGEIWIRKDDRLIAFKEYFPTPDMQHAALAPFRATSTLHAYNIVAVCQGGGLQGQAGALSLAIARALVAKEPHLKPALKLKKLLTRDPRQKERKKPGQPGARKQFQFSKR